MRDRRNILWEKAPKAASAACSGWAQRLVRRQLDTLSRLAAAALRLVEDAARQAADLVAVERAIRLHERGAWALRLIDALRAKLSDDLQRLARGEAPEVVLKTEASTDGEAAQKSFVAKPERLTAEKAERGETLDRERLGRCGRLDRDDAFGDILKLPTDEIIALICRELGLPLDWPRLAEQAWESEEERGETPFLLDGGRVEVGGGSLSGKPPDG